MKEGRLFTPPEAPVAECVRMHAALGIERGVLVHSAVYGTDLRCSYDALVEMQGRWRGVALIGGETSANELARLHEAGFRGVRINFVDGGATPPLLEAAAERLKPFGWHVQLLVKLDRIAELAPLIDRLPVECVLDHMGYTRAGQGVAHPGLAAMLALLARARCWVKLSGADRIGDSAKQYADARPVMQALVDANCDRLIWGTDWPHVHKRVVPNDGDLLNLFAEWVPDAGVRRKILVENPARLYGF